MKTFLFFFICIPVITPAADWDLFQLNQKSIYRYSQNTDRMMSWQTMDSSAQNGSDLIYYFRMNLDYENAGSCYQQVMPDVQISSEDITTVDSLVQRNDSVFYNSGYSSLPFFFLPQSQPGQAWTVTSTYSWNDYSQITISCVSNQLETFLGITDSVKTFSLLPSGTSAGQIPINNLVMKLSRNYGLIEFVPIKLFMYHPPQIDFFSLKLTGFDSAGTVFGEARPGLQDYFHLSAGDVLLWLRTMHPDNVAFPSWNEYFRDSILQVYSSPDSVVYDLFVTRLDSDSVVSQYFETIRYRLTDFNDLFSAPDFWFTFQDGKVFPWSMYPSFPVILWNTGPVFLIPDSLTQDTILQTNFDSWEYGLDTTSCTVQGITDIGRSFDINTLFGITKYCNYFFGFDCYWLQAADVGGLHYGNTDLVTDIFSISSVPTLNVFPNPFHETATLSGKLFSGMQGKNCILRIINLVGAVVQTEEFIWNGSHRIHRDNLFDGIYFYELSTSDHARLASGRFVVD